jgi:hypothetical protein
MNCDIFLGLCDEEVEIVVRGTKAADVGDETFRAGYPGLAEHPVEFLAADTLKWIARSFLVEPRSFAHEHDSGRDRAFRSAEHLNALRGQVFADRSQGFDNLLSLSSVEVFEMNLGNRAPVGGENLQHVHVIWYSSYQTILKAHFNSPNRLTAIPYAVGSISIPVALTFISCAAGNIVPEPQKGSRTESPALQLRERRSL